jgi:OOP family OmpA-OmpF porin
MAARGGNWRYGLLPLACLWLGVNAFETSRIEAELASRARDALRASGGVARVAGRDVTLTGEIEDERARTAALAGVAALDGVRVTEDASSLRSVAGAAPSAPAAPAAREVDSGEGAKSAAVSPYLFHADLSASKLTLTGAYPDPAAHARMVGAAARASGGRELVDRMQAGLDAPRDFIEAAVTGLGELARLREGAFDLRDHAALLRGEAARAEIADDIRSSLVSALPGGFAVQSQLTGPARETAPQPAAASAPVKPQPPAIAAEAPALSDEKETVAAVRVEAQDIPGKQDNLGKKGADAASGEAGAPACAARIAALATAQPIDFAVGRARLTAASAETLDAVAAQANRCPDVNFEIAGHTDDIGYVSENRELSRRRAENVLVYLVAAGVSPKRLSAVGYGESQPLVPNDNDENRAKNRRIEFNPKQGRQP